jgi:hypothetical protein
MDGQDEFARLLGGLLPAAARKRGCAALACLEIPESLCLPAPASINRSGMAMALAVLLFADLLERVPSGRAYVAAEQASGRKVVLDHGALRTIRFAEGPTGALPPGREAFARILEPLGYEMAATYPLPRLRMTGYVYRHAVLPADLPQYFVSELEVAQFDAGFAAVAHRVFDPSHDPLDPAARAVLARFAEDAMIPLDEAAAALPALVAAFGRQHGPIRLADYAALLAQSPEAAWIATEGNAFNHATDRVPDVAALAERLRGDGAPVKDAVEVSASGRVRQTALRADPMERDFLGDEGTMLRRTVPGSFYEFITRAIDPATGELDLAFDSGNATGIFGMTRSV